MKAKTHRVLLLTALAAVLYLAGGLALAWIAGFDKVWNAAQHPQWPWLAASLGFVALASSATTSATAESGMSRTDPTT